MTIAQHFSSQNSPPSERHFGLFLAGVLITLSGIGYSRGWEPFPVIAGGILGLAAALIALIAPRFLLPANQAWFRLGQLLGSVVSPLVLAILFYGLLTPIAMASRLSGRDELRLRRRPCDSYWLDRQPPGPAPDSFTQQF